MPLRLRLAVCILLAGVPLLARAEASLAGIFGDHMVLQRDAPIPVWGSALPGEAVQVSLAGRTRRTRADAAGRWALQLPAAPAGGPHELVVKASNTRVLRDVLVGDVWLCAGQSNMAWTVAQSQDAERELAAASHPLIRHVKIGHRASLRPQHDGAPAIWQASSPADAGGFSAVAYFFAQRLQQAPGARSVPIGLINASWGGSHIETWTRPGAALADPVLAPFVRALPADAAAFGAQQAERALAVAQRFQGDLPLPGVAAAAQTRRDWAAPALDDSAWPMLNAPQPWEAQGLPGFDGTLWYRRSLALTAEQAAAPATLHLAMVDDCDETWVNGQRVGGLCQWDAHRAYPLPAGLLQAGRNVIALRVMDSGGGGGLHGPPDTLRLDTAAGSLPLHGPWRARVEAPLVKAEPGPNDGPGLLFNGMLQPLTPLRLRGVLWYQGESNVPRAARYGQDFKRLITDWRQQWQQPGLPFLYVQLAAFLPLDRNSLQHSAWAELREAQRQALSLPGTGMVVATDVGDANDIHPRDKRSVGQRLAGLAWRQPQAGRQGVATGPVYRRLQGLGAGRLALQFSGAAGGLAVRGGGVQLAGFALAGADRRFQPARAEIRNGRVLVWADAVAQPRAVRYGWVDNPSQANLIDRAGLPASPFRTDDWPLSTAGVTPVF